MNTYFITDTHFGMKGDSPIWLDDCIGYFKKVFIPYVKEHVKPEDCLISLGDVFDNRSNIGIETICRVIELFEEFSEIFSQIIIIVGNHDIFKKHSNDITSLNMLKHIPKIKIVYKPEVMNLGGKNILMLPWIEEVEEQKKLIKSHNVDYVFGHLEIGGCVTNSNKGMVLKTNNSIESKDFKKAQVYAGHIHIRQDYKNIHYLGNPYHKDRGDIGNTKGITILNIESGRTKFIENTFSPKYISVDIHDILDTTIEELKPQWKNNYVDLVVDSKEVTECNFETVRELLKDYYREFKVDSKNKQPLLQTTTDIELSESKSAIDHIDEYINQLDIDDDEKENIIGVLKEYNER